MNEKDPILKMINNVIGKSLEYVTIIRDGANRTMANVRVLPKDMLENPPEALKNHAMLKDIASADVVLGGSVGEDPTDLDYLLILDNDSRAIRIQSFKEEATPEFFESFTRHLLVEGLSAHRLIHTVRTPANSIMPDGVDILAKGPGIDVKFTKQGEWSSEVGIDADISEILGDGDGLGSILSGALKRMAEGRAGKDDCNCELCQARRKMTAEEEKEEGVQIH